MLIGRLCLQNGANKMAKSIMQTGKYCYLCSRTTGIEEHHIYFGSLRMISEKHGFKVWLCADHHRGNNGPHQRRVIDLLLKKLCQRKFEETHSREEFMKIIGRNYLDDRKDYYELRCTDECVLELAVTQPT